MPTVFIMCAQTHRRWLTRCRVWTRLLPSRIALLALPLLSGCGDLLSPEAFTVRADPSSVRLTATKTPVTVLGFTFVYYRCDYRIALSANGGRSGNSATLQMGVVRGANGERLGTVPLSELISWFGTDRIKSGQTITASLYDEMLGSWTRTVDFIYADPKGANQTVSYSIACL